MISELVDQLKLRLACQKVAEGMSEMQNLGLSKEHIMNGIKVQLDAFFADEDGDAK